MRNETLKKNACMPLDGSEYTEAGHQGYVLKNRKFYLYFEKETFQGMYVGTQLSFTSDFTVQPSVSRDSG